MALKARSKRRIQNWNFRVLIDGFDDDIKFTKVGSLEPELSTATLREGGSFTAVKDPGFVTFPAITLEKGSSEDDAIYDWFKNCVDAVANSGGLREDYMRSMTIQKLYRDGSVAKQYRLYNCFPKKPRFLDMDGSSEDYSIESVEIEYESMEKI